jgi:hypothetical protein
MKPPVAVGRRRQYSQDARDNNASQAWSRRWHELRRARLELDRWRDATSALEASFNRVIAPRERLMTRTLAELTAHLITRFPESAQNATDQALLAQWIAENLAALKEHPFAPADRVRALSSRWRELVAPDAPSEPAPAPDDRQDTNTGRPSPAQGPTQQRHPSDARCAGEPSEQHTANEDHTPPPAAPVEDIALGNLIAPLFRRLAQALHPDRELDANRRKIKQALMQQALDARESQDMDALLSLYLEHVGHHVDVIEGMDSTALLRALERQMEKVQRALRVIRFGNPLRRRIMERYGTDPERRERLIEQHASQLDKAIATVSGLCTKVQSKHGMHAALALRRDAELDRRTINELTGVD